MKPSPESVLTWSKFSKVSSTWSCTSPGSCAPWFCTPPLTYLLPQDGAAGFSFWAWLDGILGLLQEHLKKLWKDG